MQLLENPACDRRCLSRIPAHVFEPQPALFQWLKTPRKALPDGQKNLPARTGIFKPLAARRPSPRGGLLPAFPGKGRAPELFFRIN